MKKFLMHLVTIKDILTNDKLFTENQYKKYFISKEMTEMIKDSLESNINIMDIVLTFSSIVCDWMEEEIPLESLLKIIDDTFVDLGVSDIVDDIIFKANRAYELKQLGEKLIKNPIIIDET